MSKFSTINEKISIKKTNVQQSQQFSEVPWLSSIKAGQGTPQYNETKFSTNKCYKGP